MSQSIKLRESFPIPTRWSAVLPSIPTFENPHRGTKFLRLKREWARADQRHGKRSPGEANLAAWRTGHVWDLVSNPEECHTLIVERMRVLQDLDARTDPKWAALPSIDTLPPYQATAMKGTARDRLIYGPVRKTLRSSMFSVQSEMELGWSRTLAVLYNQCKDGVFVAIKANQLYMFQPFRNLDYVNAWPPGRVPHHVVSTRTRGPYHSDTTVLRDTSRWYVDGVRVQNTPGALSATEAHMGAVYDLLQAVCAQRQVPNCVCFIHNDQVPRVADTDRSPFTGLRDETGAGLLTPVLGFTTSDTHFDLAIPTPGEWQLATSTAFPPEYTNDTVKRNVKLFKQKQRWEVKINRVYWRGLATGRGVEPARNLRLRMAMVTRQLALEDDFLRDNAVDNPTLDVRLSGLPTYDILQEDGVFCHFRKGDHADLVEETEVTYTRWAENRYVLCVPGQAPAYELGVLLASGSCILMVQDEQDNGLHLWYDRALKPGEHYLPVKADVSDLRRVLTWCGSNPDQCRAIGSNARTFWETQLSQSSILDYMQVLLSECAALTQPRPVVEEVEEMEMCSSVEPQTQTETGVKRTRSPSPDASQKRARTHLPATDGSRKTVDLYGTLWHPPQLPHLSTHQRQRHFRCSLLHASALPLKHRITWSLWMQQLLEDLRTGMSSFRNDYWNTVGEHLACIAGQVADDVEEFPALRCGCCLPPAGYLEQAEATGAKLKTLIEEVGVLPRSWRKSKAINVSV